MFVSWGHRLNTSGGSEAAVTARTRIGWIKFRECRGVALWKKVFVKDKKQDILRLV